MVIGGADNMFAPAGAGKIYGRRWRLIKIAGVIVGEWLRGLVFGVRMWYVGRDFMLMEVAYVF